MSKVTGTEHILRQKLCVPRPRAAEEAQGPMQGAFKNVGALDMITACSVAWM